MVHIRIIRQSIHCTERFIMTNLRIFKHWKGKHYLLLHEGIYESTGQPIVVYQSVATGDIFVRESKDFYSMMVDNGVDKPKFEELT